MPNFSNLSEVFSIDFKALGIDKLDDALKTVQDIDKAIKELNQARNKADLGTKQYNDLTKALAEVKNFRKGIIDQQKQVEKALSSPATAAAGSYRALNAELLKLKNQYKDLSESERNSQFGESTIKQIQKLDRELKSIDANIGQYQRNVGNYPKTILSLFEGTSLGKVADIVQGISSKVPAILAFTGALTAVSNVSAATKEYERLFATLNQNLGSNFKAERTFELLEKFAKDTPNQLTSVIDAYTKLSTSGLAPTIEQLQIISDISATRGKSLNQFSEALLDAQTGEFERLKEFGITVRRNGKNTDELTVKYANQEKVILKNNDALVEYIYSLGKLPQIQGASANIAATLTGALSNLSDSFTSLMASIGEGSGFGDILKSSVQGLSNFLDIVNELIKTPLSEKLKTQKDEFNALALAIQNENKAIKEGNGSVEVRDELIKRINTQFPDYIGNIDLSKASELDFNRVVSDGNKLFERRIFLQATEEERTKLIKQKLDAIRKTTNLEVQGSAPLSTAEAQRAGGGFIPALLIQEQNKNLNKSLIELNRKEITAIDQQIKKFDETTNKIGSDLFGSLEAFKKATIESGNIGATPKRDTKGNAVDEKAINKRKDQLEALERELAETKEDIAEKNTEALLKIEENYRKALIEAIEDERTRELELENDKFRKEKERINQQGIERESAILDKLQNLRERLKDSDNITKADRQKIQGEISRLELQASDVRAQIEEQSNREIQALTEEHRRKTLSINQRYDEKDKQELEKKQKEERELIEKDQKANLAFLKNSLDTRFKEIDLQTAQAKDSISEKSRGSNVKVTELDAKGIEEKLRAVREILKGALLNNEAASFAGQALPFSDEAIQDLTDRAIVLETQLTDVRRKGLIDRKKLAEQEKEILIDSGFQAAKLISDGISQIQRDRLDTEINNEIAALDKTYKAKIDAAQNNKAEQERLTAELEEKKKDIEVKAIEERADLAKSEARLNAALTIIKTFAQYGFTPAGFAAAALAGIATAVQVATIDSEAEKQKAAVRAEQGAIIGNGNFRLGKDIKGKRHSEGGELATINGVRVEAEQGERFDMDENGNAYIFSRTKTQLARKALDSVADKMFNGKGEILRGIMRAESGAYLPKTLPNSANYISKKELSLQVNITNEQMLYLGEIIAQRTGASVYDATITASQTTERMSERKNAVINNATI